MLDKDDGGNVLSIYRYFIVKIDHCSGDLDLKIALKGGVVQVCL